jgi:hypothetical protein
MDSSNWVWLNQGEGFGAFGPTFSHKECQCSRGRKLAFLRWTFFSTANQACYKMECTIMTLWTWVSTHPLMSWRLVAARNKDVGVWPQNLSKKWNLLSTLLSPRFSSLQSVQVPLESWLGHLVPILKASKTREVLFSPA